MAEISFDDFGDAPTAPVAAAPTADQIAQGQIPHHPVVGPETPNYTGAGALTDAARFANTATVDALAAVGSTPRAIAQGVDWLGKRVPPYMGYAPQDIGADAALASVQQPSWAPHPGRQVFPDSETLKDAMFGPTAEYVPATRVGKDALAGTTMALSSLAGGPKQIVGGFLAGAGANEGATVLPDHPLVGSLIGSTMGLATGGLAAAGAQKTAAVIRNGGAITEPYGAFTRLGLPTDLSGTVTGSPWLMRAEKMAGDTPGAASHITNAREALLEGWRQKLTDTADKIGTASTQQELGTALQDGANKWLSNWRATSGGLWDDFAQTMPAGTPIDVSNYQSALSKALSNFPGAPATSGVLQTGTLKNLSHALTSDLGTGTTLPVETVQNIRSAIGEKLANPQIVSDTSQSALKTLYRGLTGDLTAGAASVSPEASTALAAANDATRTGHQLIENHLGGILNAETPEQAATYALQQAPKGGSRLDAITKAIPEVTGELGSYSLRRLAGDPHNPSPAAFAASMSSRRPSLSPEAHDTLFPDLARKQDIADLTATAAKVKALEHGKPSEASGLARLYTSIEGAKVGHEMGGIPGAAAGLAVGAALPSMTGWGAGRVLNPTVSGLAGRMGATGAPWRPELASDAASRAIRYSFYNTLPQSSHPTDNMFDGYADAPASKSP